MENRDYYQRVRMVKALCGNDEKFMAYIRKYTTARTISLLNVLYDIKTKEIFNEAYSNSFEKQSALLH